MSQNYTAYIGSYTFHGSSQGIAVCDVDMENGQMTVRSEVPVNNAAYLTVSADKRFLYAVVDEGIAAFRVLSNGNLRHLNTAGIKGMRGCYVSTDKRNRYIFVAGYHDGKATVLRLNQDGSVGDITAEIYDRGVGSVAERNFRPHITCVRLTPDEKFLCVADPGIDQVKIYRFNHEDGSLRMVDIIRCELESAPRHLGFSPDGRHMYLLSELKNYITTYDYNGEGSHPEFKFKQLVSTLPKKYNEISAACAIRMSRDGKYVFCSNAGDDSVGIFSRDEESGLLYQESVLPISGEYPKDIILFPDGRHLASLNQDSNSVTFFKIDYEKEVLMMHGAPIRLDSPNSGVIVPLPEN
ncbi:lactonase family protein [Cuneatibacter caecimuris]|uniref:6-phosphogluconolactonase n=1 Tax=Cuneatibacter caecimuris TaxID=1796618 RepID=A0A4Q7PNF5_9FIRM|nr:lactonase family protein [Cuneatibacter caecimuris]RZT02489.1 6-phosphogluconolactonase [Cuneatibacter caecimuris]